MGTVYSTPVGREVQEVLIVPPAGNKNYILYSMARQAQVQVSLVTYFALWAPVRIKIKMIKTMYATMQH